MSLAVEILVPESEEAMLRRALGEEADVAIRPWPSRVRNLKRVVFAFVDQGCSVSGYEGFERLLGAVKDRRLQRSDLTCVLGAWGKETAYSAAVAADLIEASRSVCSRAFVASDRATLRRLVRARQLGAEDRLIAAAAVDARNLLVWSAEPRLFRVPVDEMPAFRRLSETALQDFQVSASGSRIHWNDGDLDLDLDAVRELVDPDFRRRRERHAREEVARYGKAIRSLRERTGLRQNGIPGVSERQLRRIEEGGVLPRSATLEKLAAAHGMKAPDYLQTLATNRPARRSK